MSKALFSKTDREQIAAAISKAECCTSSEIRVHIEAKCPGDAVQTAVEVFDRLEMFKTRDRNAVLIFLCPNDKKFAIIGDTAINNAVGQGFWDCVYDGVVPFFKKKEYTNGLIFAIEQAGFQLQKHFPLKKDDTNELSNDVSFGEEGDE